VPARCSRREGLEDARRYRGSRLLARADATATRLDLNVLSQVRGAAHRARLKNAVIPLVPLITATAGRKQVAARLTPSESEAARKGGPQVLLNSHA
jgi:hypothetical protein